MLHDQRDHGRINVVYYIEVVMMIVRTFFLKFMLLIPPPPIFCYLIKFYALKSLSFVPKKEVKFLNFDASLPRLVLNIS